MMEYVPTDYMHSWFNILKCLQEGLRIECSIVALQTLHVYSQNKLNMLLGVRCELSEVTILTSNFLL